MLDQDLRPRTIVDPIHGQIRLTDAELSVINHSLFRRLTRIRQNGLLYLVFPSATHHRFEHSIGVLHVADAMLDSLWSNSFVASQKGAVASFAESRDGHSSNPRLPAVDFSQVPSTVLRWIVRVTRLAALVHDLGHGPLSHTFDSFALRRDALEGMLTAGVIPGLSSFATELAGWDRHGAEGSVAFDLVPHEVMSCVLFAQIWADIRAERDSTSAAASRESNGSVFSPLDAGDARDDASLPITVAAAILGKPELASGILPPELVSWLPLVHDVIASAPADADRMDYLERDSRAIGVSYGLFDRGRVLKSFLCYRETSDGEVSFRLGVKRSGLPSLENFVQARYELFVQVYLHKTNRAISLMLDEIATRAKNAGVSIFPPVDPDNSKVSFERVLDRYIDLSDDVFLRALRGREPSILPDPPSSVQVLADAVSERRLWKRLYEGDEGVAYSVASSLREVPEFSEISEDIHYDSSNPKATKDLERGAALLTRDATGIYVATNSANWNRASVIIDALYRAERSIGRIYARGAALKALAPLRLHVRAIAAPLEVAHERRQREFDQMRDKLATLIRANRIPPDLRAHLLDQHEDAPPAST